MLILNKDDLEIVTQFPCLLGHSVQYKGLPIIGTLCSLYSKVYPQANDETSITNQIKSEFQYCEF